MNSAAGNLICLRLCAVACYCFVHPIWRNGIALRKSFFIQKVIISKSTWELFCFCFCFCFPRYLSFVHIICHRIDARFELLYQRKRTKYIFTLNLIVHVCKQQKQGAYYEMHQQERKCVFLNYLLLATRGHWENRTKVAISAILILLLFLPLGQKRWRLFLIIFIYLKSTSPIFVRWPRALFCVP